MMRVTQDVPRGRRSVDTSIHDSRLSDWHRHVMDTLYVAVAESDDAHELYAVRCSTDAQLGHVLRRLGYDANTATCDGYILVPETLMAELIPLGHLVPGRTSKLPLHITAARDFSASTGGARQGLHTSWSRTLSLQ
jgi:hypothetical protein